MNIYKRFEWWLEVPGRKPHYFTADDRAQAEAKAPQLAGKLGAASFQLGHDPAATYFGRFFGLDPERPGKTKQYLRELGTANKADALKNLKALKAKIDAGRFKEADTTKARQERESTFADLYTSYRRAARAIGSVDLNINAMRNILRRVYSPATSLLQARKANEKVDALPVSVLSAQLVRTWKQKMHDAVEAEKARGPREQQILRSANSILRQARSIFGKDLPAHYRDEKLTIPAKAVLDEFLDSPGFDDTGKTDYNAPADKVITATFEALTDMGKRKLSEDDRNLYIAVWLALGFGLRKSEVAACRNSWFIKRDDVIFCRGDVLAKDGQVPDIRVQLGAWDKLEPLLAGKPEDYVLRGTKTERTETVFRRVSEWMERIGWNTHKKEHELRAFAGSKVCEANGTQAAQVFMRHKSFTTTEKFYLRYMNIKMKEVTLQLPAEPAVATAALAAVA